jgi:hypothetical protein
MTSNRTKRVGLILFILLACIALFVSIHFVDSSQPSFTIGKDTTRITEPVDAEGYIDYAAALNQRLREGVTPENNANVLLLQAYGPRPEGAPLKPEYYEALGIAPPPESGNYFAKLHAFVRNELKLDNESLTRIEDNLIEARTRPWDGGDFPELAQWLQANEKPLALVIEASKRPQYYNPVLPTSDPDGRHTLTTCLLPTVQNGRVMVTALTARAMFRLKAGQTDAAWEDLLASHRLARHIGSGGTLIEAMVGFAIEAIAASTDLAYLQHSTVDRQRLDRILRDLDALPRMRPLSERFDVGERFMALDMIAMIDRRGPKALHDGLGLLSANPDLLERFLYSNAVWEPAMRNTNIWFDRMVGASETKDPQQRRQKLAEVESEIVRLKEKAAVPGKAKVLRTLFSRSGKGEHMGDILIATLLPAIVKVQSAADRHEQSLQNLRVAIALDAYRKDHGDYPTKLDALVPVYLKTIPLDLFSGKPLKFEKSPDGYLLYSIGPNEADDLGRGASDTPRGDDLPVRVPIPPHKKE